MSNLLVRTALSAAIAFSFASVTSAQEGEEAIFEEIIVTAKKREQSIYEVPSAISAFSADAIEKQGIKTLIDVGKFVPNLNVTAFSAGHTSSANPFIRGIGLQDHLITTDPGVSVYVDGVYLGRQVGQNWNLTNVERIEVLRGPQGTLFGRNSIGGAINIITRKPGVEDEGQVSLEYGSRGRLNAEFYANRRLSDQFSISVSGGYQSRDGIGDFINIPDPEADVGELKEISGRVAMMWEPTDQLSILFTADANNGDGGLRPYTTLIDELPNGAVFGAGFRNSDLAADPYDNATGQVNQTGVENNAEGYALTVDYEVSDTLSAKLIASYRESEYESGLDDDGFFEDFLSFPEVGEAEQTSIELQFTGENGPWDYVGGFYYFEEEGSNTQNRTVFLGGLGDFALAQEVESWAIYANVGYQVSDALRLSGGLRYTEDEKEASVNINSSLIEESNSRDWDEVTWEFSATYDVNDSLTAFGTIASGYQSGQYPPRPFCLFGSLDFSQPGNVSRPNCFEANENITAVNYEVGLKGEPTRNLQLAVSAFLTDYEDLPYQVSTTSGGGFDTRNIIVDQQSIGLEVEGIWAVTSDFRIQASMGLIDVDVDEDGAEAPLTPDVTFAIGPEYTMETANGSWNFRADWSYRDDMFGEPNRGEGRFTGIDSRNILNFDVSYTPASEAWTAGLYGRNVTDERYDNARLNVSDYVIVILSNDASEFGLRFTSFF